MDGPVCSNCMVQMEYCTCMGEPDMPVDHSEVAGLHYEAGGIETIEFIKAKLTPEQYRGYLLGTIIKYLSRTNTKGETEADARKALVFLTWYVETFDGDVTE